MSDDAYKKRIYRARQKTLEHYKGYPRVDRDIGPPVNIFVPLDLSYVRWDLDEVTPDVRAQLKAFKKTIHPTLRVRVFLYTLKQQHAQIIEI